MDHFTPRETPTLHSGLVCCVYDPPVIYFTRRRGVDALLDAKPSRAELCFPTPRLWTASLFRRPESEGAVILTMVVFLGVVMLACLIGIAVIPRFDRRAPLSPPQAVAATQPSAAPSRSA
jgi:hypothetical protein